MNIKPYIPEESSPLQEKFINYIMLDGKKSTARTIFNDTLKIISKKVAGDPEKIFKSAIDNARPEMEVRPKRIGGGVYQIPREVPPGRALALACRWIIGGARGKKGTNIGGVYGDFLYKNDLTGNVAFVEIKTPCTDIIDEKYRGIQDQRPPRDRGPAQGRARAAEVFRDGPGYARPVGEGLDPRRRA